MLERRFRAPLLTVSLGIGLFSFNEFLVTTALPSAVRDTSGAALMSGAVSVYLLPSIASGSAAAFLKRRLGARLVLLLAGLMFLAGTLVAAAAPTMLVILAGRVLQGTGDGLIASLCYALIPALFPASLIGRVFGVEALIWAISAFGGPALAGWVTQWVSWRAAFLLNVPLVAGFLLLVPLVAPRGAPGAATAPPASPMRLSRQMRTIYGVVLLMPLAQAVSGVYLVLALQRLWGLRPGTAGSIGALMALSWSGSALLVAPWPLWRRHLVRFGPLLNAVGLAGLLLGLQTGWLALVIAAQITVGTGFGASWAALSQGAMESAGLARRERAASLLPVVQSAGYAGGAAIAGLLANAAGLPQAVSAGVSIAPALTAAYGGAVLIATTAALLALRLRVR